MRIVLLQVRYWSQVLTHLQLASGTSASSSSRGNGEGLPAISPTKRNIHFSSNTLYLVLVMFPTKGKERRFQHSWLQKFPGLVYSESENGGFSQYCILFGRCAASVKELGVLVCRPLINFKKVTEILVTTSIKTVQELRSITMQLMSRLSLLSQWITNPYVLIISLAQ